MCHLITNHVNDSFHEPWMKSYLSHSSLSLKEEAVSTGLVRVRTYALEFVTTILCVTNSSLSLKEEAVSTGLARVRTYALEFVTHIHSS